jgi:hypothetical protein
MSTAVAELLRSFDSLSERDQREALLGVLRRTLPRQEEALSDHELIALAEETFLQMDSREAEDAAAPAR